MAIVCSYWAASLLSIVRIDCHEVGASGDHGLNREYHISLDKETFSRLTDMHLTWFLESKKLPKF